MVSTDSGNSTGFIIDTIGAAYSDGDLDFQGRMDEVWIFDETIDAATVGLLYTNNSPVTPLPTELLHHRYDTDLTDSSTSSNDGTATGNAAITTNANSVATGGGSLGLDGGASSYVTLDSPISFSATAKWSITWWARRGESGGQKGMVMGERGNTKNFIWLNDNFSGLRFRSNTSASHDFTAAKDSNLHHYALVADGAGTLSLYRDGQWSQDKTGDTSFVLDTLGEAYNTSLYTFKGSLDEVRVFGDVLVASQVEKIYNDERPLDEPDLLVTRLRVLLVGGQSNADGRASTSELPTSPVNLQQPQDDVDFFYKIEGGLATLTTLRPGLSETSAFGPSITLGRKMADLWAGETGTRVAVIKYANGGTNLHTQWKGGGNATTTGDGSEYVTFQETVNAGLAQFAIEYPNATLELQGMVWMQGESDITNGTAAQVAAYQANLTAFIADVRATYGTDLPFIIGRLSNGQTALSASRLAQVRAAQDAVEAADPRTGIIDTDGFGMNGDDLHFNGAGQQSMGTDFATELAYYEWMLDEFTSAEIDAGNAEPDADPDGDGRTNRTEFIGDSAPKDATSQFKAWITLPTSTTAEIHYNSSAFRRYAVEEYQVAAETWVEILSYELGDGAVKGRTITPITSPQIFRVRSDLP